MVFTGHAIGGAFQYLPIQNTFLEKLLKTFTDGGTGVSLFYVLSGFLITYLLISEHDLNGKINIKFFYIRRALRIWPLYFAVLILSFFIFPFIKSLIGYENVGCSRFIYYLLFLSNFDLIHTMQTCLGNVSLSLNVMWSVSVEEQFYLFWPMLFVVLHRRFWIYAILSIITASVVFRIINHNNEVFLNFHTFAVLMDLGIGGLLAYINKTSRRVSTFFESVTTAKHLFFFILSLVLLLWGNEFADFGYNNAVSRIFISISFACIISAQSFSKSESVMNLKNLGFAKNWGKYTYGIYLIHPIAINITDVVFRLFKIPTSNFFSILTIGLISFILTLTLSKISYHFFELKFLKLKEKFSLINTSGA